MSVGRKTSEPAEVVTRNLPRIRAVNWGPSLLDSLCWYLAIVVAAALKYDFSLRHFPWLSLQLLIVVTMVVQFVVGMLLHVYSGRYLVGAFEEARAVALTFAVTGILMWVATMAVGPQIGISRTLMPIAFFIALMMAWGLRYFWRLTSERENHPHDTATPALILGVGFVGQRLARWMSADVASAYRPVGMLDDDPAKQNIQVRGVPVLGTLDDLEEVVRETGAEVLVVAVANAPASLMRRVQDAAKEVGVAVKVMPPMGEIVDRGVSGSDLRDLSVDDLLGRAVVDTNVSEIAGYLTGKRVLVTGAGGSIGSQLCVEIAKFGPSKLMMLDRDETGLQDVQIGTQGNGLLESDAVILADIRDGQTLKDLFEERRPEVVFHAAALKHLPMLEHYPDEAWKTNILGTLNVLQAAQSVQVETFVNISTDKAANPTSVLGHSKRVAEKLTSHAGEKCGCRYISVRFGNVIGSRGSMLPTFTRLIEEGKPLTVTHPDVTRYFMTIPEACQLVLQAGGIGSTGEVLILDMGEPVKILDIAQRMIAMSGKDIDIVFTGLREGEKMDEDLVADDEDEIRPFHPKISHAPVKPLGPKELDKAHWDALMAARDPNAGHRSRLRSELVDAWDNEQGATGSNRDNKKEKV